MIIVHGICEHTWRYEYVVSRLNNFGYSVYRFDNRGHGIPFYYAHAAATLHV